MSAPVFTVLIPTHDHADTLWYSVASIQNQTRQDFELFIVGDGVPERTREVVATLIARDPRIRFFDNPKGERHGEAHRHAALQEARGRYVCYQSDDDLWFPEHLERMAFMLEQHDLAHTMQININPDGSATTRMYDARLPEAKKRMRQLRSGFGLASGGHTLEAYRRLPRGWFPAPPGFNTDLHFWLQFLDQPWCRYTSLKWPTLCHLASVQRRDWSNAERIAELALWWPRIRDAQQRCNLIERAFAPLAQLTLCYGVPPEEQTEVEAQRKVVRRHIKKLETWLDETGNRPFRKFAGPFRRIARRLAG